MESSISTVAAGREPFRVETDSNSYIVDALHRLLEKYRVNGLMHITGGSFTKLKDILGTSDALLFHTKKLKPQKIFYELYEKGVPDAVMYSTFNCGIGFVISASPKDAQKIVSHVKNTDIIGEVVRGSGKVIIASAFSENLVAL